jgi:hypothetical protein
MLGMRLRLLVLAMLFGALLVPGLAPAEALTTHEIVLVEPTAEPFVNPCTGDLVVLTGQVRSVIHAVVDSSGGFHAVSLTTDAQGTGLNLADNGDYIFRYRNFQELNADVDPAVDPGARSEVTFEDVLHVVRVGEDPPDDDFVVRLLTHVTIDANRQPHAVFGRPTVECR